MENSNYRVELRRVFLLEDLPEGLTRASEHLQLFDNHIKGTRMRLRYIRVPQTNEWTRILQQRFPARENELSVWRVSEIFLNEDEYQTFEKFEGREIRKNRYFYEFQNKQIEIDVFLGELWGLCLGKIYFATVEEMRLFEKPELAIAEVTNNKFFTGENLVGKNFADVQTEFEKMVSG